MHISKTVKRVNTYTKCVWQYKYIIIKVVIVKISLYQTVKVKFEEERGKFFSLLF